ncbi:cysteine proteinase [Panus rudis PR-1116 ss-1]|nr:cysteine proteinase [Panus rudis PR-1116 ss-1]
MARGRWPFGIGASTVNQVVQPTVESPPSITPPDAKQFGLENCHGTSGGLDTIAQYLRHLPLHFGRLRKRKEEVVSGMPLRQLLRNMSVASLLYCYANSVLQALYFCGPFRDLLLQYPDPSVSDVPPPPPAVPSPPPPAPTKPKPSRKLSVSDSPHIGSPNPPHGGGGASGPNASGGTNLPGAIPIPPSPPTLLSALRSLYLHISRNPADKGTVAPRAFIDKLKELNELFRTPQHQDAHEFLNFMLNKIEEEMEEDRRNGLLSAGNSTGTSGSGEDLTQSISTLSSGVAAPTSTVSASTSQPFNSSSSSSSNTLVHRLFEGVLTSETRCLTCETVSSRDESFLDLSLDIEQNSSLTACLRQFSASEMLCQKNKFFCDSCCDLQEAEKRMKIKKLPNILALHLKRFKYQEDTGRYIKLAYRVAFPFQLRLFNTVDDAENPDRLYELFAIVVHIGNGPHHGHYVSIIKARGQWYLFDDDTVETIKEGDIARYYGDSNGSAYVLYYQAVDLDLVELGLRSAAEAGTGAGAGTAAGTAGAGTTTAAAETTTAAAAVATTIDQTTNVPYDTPGSVSLTASSTSMEDVNLPSLPPGLVPQPTSIEPTSPHPNPHSHPNPNPNPNPLVISPPSPPRTQSIPTSPSSPALAPLSPRGSNTGLRVSIPAHTLSSNGTPTTPTGPSGSGVAASGSGLGIATPSNLSPMGLIKSLRHSPSGKMRGSMAMLERSDPPPPLPIPSSPVVGEPLPMAMDSYAQAQAGPSTSNSNSMTNSLESYPAASSSASASVPSTPTKPNGTGKERDREPERKQSLWFKRKKSVRAEEKLPPSSFPSSTSSFERGAFGFGSGSGSGSGLGLGSTSGLGSVSGSGLGREKEREEHHSSTGTWLRHAGRLGRRASEMGLTGAGPSSPKTPSSSSGSPMIPSSPLVESKRSSPDMLANGTPPNAGGRARRLPPRPSSAGAALGSTPRPRSAIAPPLPPLPGSPTSPTSSSPDGRIGSSSSSSSKDQKFVNGSASPEPQPESRTRATTRRITRPLSSSSAMGVGSGGGSPGLGFSLTSSSNGTSSTLGTNTSFGGDPGVTGVSSPPVSGSRKRTSRKLSFTGTMLGFGRRDKDKEKEKERREKEKEVSL